MDPQTEKIVIDPVTRLEGHGKIEIFLNEKGDAEKRIPGVRGLLQGTPGRGHAPDHIQDLRRLPDSSSHGIHQVPG
jgi:hypothetical protein